MAAPEVVAQPLGEPPHFKVRMFPAPGLSLPSKRCESGLEAQVSGSVPLEGLRDVVSARLGVPPYSLIFLANGENLDSSKSLRESEVTLPGPTARKRGEGLELLFDVTAEAIDRERQALVAVEAQKQAEEQRAFQAQRNEERRRRNEEAERRRKEEAAKQQNSRVEVTLEGWVQKWIGVDAGLQQELLRSPVRLEEWEKSQVGAQNHYLEECGPEITAAVQRLLKAQVHKVYRNHNDTLRRRYNYAKSLLMQGGGIAEEASDMQRSVQGEPGLEFLGPFESSINEYPMWHGTPSAQAAGGICEIGFDVARCGQHGLLWGHGFYFADSVQVSARYVSPFHVNSQHTVSVMMLCRMLGGRVKSLQHPPTEEEQEAHTAQCLGKGGNFGAEGSQFHSIKGSNYCWVSLHRDQVYPELVILCGHIPSHLC